MEEIKKEIDAAFSSLKEQTEKSIQLSNVEQDTEDMIKVLKSNNIRAIQLVIEEKKKEIAKNFVDTIYKEIYILAIMKRALETLDARR